VGLCTTQLVEQRTRSGVSVTGAVPNVDDREPLGEVNLIHQTHPISDFDIVSDIGCPFFAKAIPSLAAAVATPFLADLALSILFVTNRNR
jgi:hypothetical protein